MVDDCNELYDQHELARLPAPYDKNLIYFHGRSSLTQTQSKVLREKEEACHKLVENIRLVSINKLNDGITIDPELIQNPTFFM